MSCRKDFQAQGSRPRRGPTEFNRKKFAKDMEEAERVYIPRQPVRDTNQRFERNPGSFSQPAQPSRGQRDAQYPGATRQHQEWGNPQEDDVLIPTRRGPSKARPSPPDFQEQNRDWYSGSPKEVPSPQAAFRGDEATLDPELRPPQARRYGYFTH